MVSRTSSGTSAQSDLLETAASERVGVARDPVAAVPGRRRPPGQDWSLDQGDDAAILQPMEEVRVQKAERALLELADFIYGHTSLKPMSKTLFVLSRCLLAASERAGETVAAVVRAYESRVAGLGVAAPTDDFNLADTLSECEEHLARILSTVDEVRALCSGSDSLGLAFNTLLRGKWESGEGLGTHLTPEEIVEPMVAMAIDSVTLPADEDRDVEHFLVGDPCGGTGRFAYSIARQLRRRGYGQARLNTVLRLYDQSSLSVDLARLNFAFDRLTPQFIRVDDSLTSDILSRENGQYLAIATNPPFGSGKYRWTPELERSIGPDVLAAVGMRRTGDACDPAILFLFRCLDLLSFGGALAIILPDGIIQANTFKETLFRYEHARACSLAVLSVVSLPTVTFSLGGTVAKTSFLLVRKSRRGGSTQLYVARASHVGFKKRGNHRVADPDGNDLPEIVLDYLHKRERKGKWWLEWRNAERLMPSLLLSDARGLGKAKVAPLSRLARLRQERGRGVRRDTEDWFHVSVLDVDTSGVIDIAASSTNEPATPPQICHAGDVLVSCLNPRIWRVAVVPEIAGLWTCSGEFAVLAPHDGVDAWKLAVALHHKTVIERTVALGGGTSSSRQRVNKAALLGVSVPEISTGQKEIERYKRDRERHYGLRIREHQAFARLHEGQVRFYI